MERTKEEIAKQIDNADENDGKYYGMTYEQGVKNALEWVLGYTNEKPMEE